MALVGAQFLQVVDGCGEGPLSYKEQERLGVHEGYAIGKAAE